jgi:hypothetical protein
MIEENNRSIYDNPELKEDIRLLKQDNIKLKSQRRVENCKTSLLSGITSLFNTFSNVSEDAENILDIVDDILDD